MDNNLVNKDKKIMFIAKNQNVDNEHIFIIHKVNKFYKEKSSYP